MRKQLLLFAWLLCLLMAGCASLAEPTATLAPTSTPDPQVERYAILESGQGFIGDLRISAADFGIHTYTDDKGSAQTGFTCELTVFFQDRATPDRTERVYPGITLEVAGHHVLVDGIEKQKTNERGIVFLTILEPG